MTALNVAENINLGKWLKIHTYRNKLILCY